MENNIDAYIAIFSDQDQAVIQKLRTVIKDHLPSGFEEQLNYGMIGYVVPHSIYPKGYRCDPKLPLPFMGIARQKQAFTFYHMGIYGDPDLLEWFISSYEKSYGKLDHGKSCFRFRTKEKIPYELIGTLVEKISVQDWIDTMEKTTA